MPLGIPHSFFRGGLHQWTEDDQDKALAWRYESSLKCGGCGTAQWQWDEDAMAFVGDNWICPGCEVIEQEQGNTEDARTAGAKGVKHGLITRDEHERRMKHGHNP